MLQILDDKPKSNKHNFLRKTRYQIEIICYFQLDILKIFFCLLSNSLILFNIRQNL